MRVSTQVTVYYETAEPSNAFLHFDELEREPLKRIPIYDATRANVQQNSVPWKPTVKETVMRGRSMLKTHLHVRFQRPISHEAFLPFG